MKELTKKQHEQIEALAAIADYVVNFDNSNEKLFSIYPIINGLSLKIHF